MFKKSPCGERTNTYNAFDMKIHTIIVDIKFLLILLLILLILKLNQILILVLKFGIIKF
jgi:hypothetical protein